MLISPASQKGKFMNRFESFEHVLELGRVQNLEDPRAGAKLSANGALVVETGKYTGRAIKEKFIVKTAGTAKTIDWNKTNQPIDEVIAGTFFERLTTRLESKNAFLIDKFVGPFPVRVFTTSPWHVSFADNMFRSTPASGLSSAKLSGKKFSIFHDPSVSPAALMPEFVGKIPAEALIVVDFEQSRVAIVGTAYAGEIKKSAFSLCNYWLPEAGFFPMHSGANTLPDGTNSCVLFGLSGTGKTSLSADSSRALIGDDEIIWTDDGLWNLEGGCYAKLIDLAPTSEPEIYQAVSRFGAILENVEMDPLTRTIDFSSRKKTENSRGSYPLSHLEGVFSQDRAADAPKNIVFLTADAFGALPAVASLTTEQAKEHFLSGYTAKVAGTELGVKEPQAAFSACFGAPFMPRHPSVYADLLAKKVEATGAKVWLLNTGWFGGAYGVGKRFPIAVSRAILRAIQSGELNDVPMVKHPLFGFHVPTECPGVEAKYLVSPEGEAVRDLFEKFTANLKAILSTMPNSSPTAMSNGSSGATASNKSM